MNDYLPRPSPHQFLCGHFNAANQVGARARSEQRTRGHSWSAVATLTDRGEGDVLIHSGGERCNGGSAGKLKVKSPQWSTPNMGWDAVGSKFCVEMLIFCILLKEIEKEKF